MIHMPWSKFTLDIVASAPAGKWTILTIDKIAHMVCTEHSREFCTINLPCEDLVSTIFFKEILNRKCRRDGPDDGLLRYSHFPLIHFPHTQPPEELIRIPITMRVQEEARKVYGEKKRIYMMDPAAGLFL